MTGVVEAEKPDYAIVQFGGQTAINLAAHLEKLGVPILGTPAWSIDAAEDREKFDVILEKCGIPRPAGHTVMTERGGRQGRRRAGLPGSRPSVLRSGRSGHGDRLQGVRCPRVHAGHHPQQGREPGSGRQVHDGPRDRGRRHLRRRRHPHPGHHGALRARRRSLRRLHLHLPVHQHREEAQGHPRALHRVAREEPRRSRSGQHPVRSVQRPDLRYRGQPAFLSYRSVHLQGNGRSDGRSGDPLHVRREAARHGLRHRPAPGERPLRASRSRYSPSRSCATSTPSSARR